MRKCSPTLKPLLARQLHVPPAFCSLPTGQMISRDNYGRSADEWMDESIQIKMVWYLEGRWFRGRQLLSCWQSTAEFPIPGKHHHLIANHTKRQTKLLPTLSSSACFRLPGIEKFSFWAFIFASHTKVLELKQTCPAASVFVPPKGWLRNRRGVAFWNLHQRSLTTWAAFY